MSRRATWALLGGGVRHEITPRFRLDAKLLALTFDLDDISGTIIEADLGFSY